MRSTAGKRRFEGRNQLTLWSGVFQPCSKLGWNVQPVDSVTVTALFCRCSAKINKKLCEAVSLLFSTKGCNGRRNNIQLWNGPPAHAKCPVDYQRSNDRCSASLRQRHIVSQTTHRVKDFCWDKNLRSEEHT